MTTDIHIEIVVQCYGGVDVQHPVSKSLTAEKATYILELWENTDLPSMEEVDKISTIIENNKLQALVSPLKWIRNWDREKMTDKLKAIHQQLGDPIRMEEGEGNSLRLPLLALSFWE